MPKDFSRYEGKIVNIAEFNAGQQSTLMDRIVSVVKSPLTFVRSLSKSFKNQDVVLNQAEFYVTKDEQARFAAANPERGLNNQRASAEVSYFEASKLLKLVNETGGRGFLTSSFMKALDKAADHRSLLSEGKLEKSGYELDLAIAASKATVNSTPLPKGVTSHTTVRLH